MTPVSADMLRALATRVQRLTPDRRNPEQFHLDRDLIRAELQRLARRIEIAQSREEHDLRAPLWQGTSRRAGGAADILGL